jgi:hypothetical protein
MWIVGGALRTDTPKDIDVMVDTHLPIKHLGLDTTRLQGLRLPSGSAPSTKDGYPLEDTPKVDDLPIDLWSVRERGSLQEYLRTVPLNIQSVAYSPMTNQIEESGYLECIETRTLDLMPEGKILIESAQLKQKIKRIEFETGFALSARLIDYLNGAPDINPSQGRATKSHVDVYG